jgi:hypothetical protein
MNGIAIQDDGLSSLTDEQLEDELLIAATGSPEESVRDDRFALLLDELLRRSQIASTISTSRQPGRHLLGWWKRLGRSRRSDSTGATRSNVRTERLPI